MTGKIHVKVGTPFDHSHSLPPCNPCWDGKKPGFNKGAVTSTSLMEGRSVLRRAQSLRSVSKGDRDTPIWAEVGFRDKMKSVSSVTQMMARYQFSSSVEAGSTSTQRDLTTGIGQQKNSSSLANEKSETHMADIRVDVRADRKLQSENARVQPGLAEEREKSKRSVVLSRSKSMSSLPHPSVRVDLARGIGPLKALFESKFTQGKSVPVGPPHPKMTNMATGGKVQGSTTPEPTPDLAVTPAEVTTQVGRRMPSERRRTISHFNLEKTVTATPEDVEPDDKRKSIADFRDSSSSFSPSRENPSASVSVKAISALYLSKVAAADSTAPDPSPPTKREGKPTKMAEDGQKMGDGCQPTDSSSPPPGKGPILRQPTQPCTASLSTPSKEALSALYQQRQKVELRRLLKHTHPELKSMDRLDGVVDEELAEVLSSDIQPTAGDMGYEGEVLSRRWIFENCVQSKSKDPHDTKLHMSEGAGVGAGSGFRTLVEDVFGDDAGAGVGGEVWGDSNRTSNLFEQSWDNHEERARRTTDQEAKSGAALGKPIECEDEEVDRMDVQSARRLFESQQVNTLRANQDELVNQNKIVVSEDQRGAVQKRKQAFEKGSSKRVQREIKSPCFRNLDVAPQMVCEAMSVNANEQEDSEVQPQNERVSTVIPVIERKSVCALKADVGDGASSEIQTYQSSSLFHNNPFRTISTTGEPSHLVEPKPENTNSPPEDIAQGEMLVPLANVRNRAQLFESTQFDLINHQNREEIESVVESINNTLISLHQFNTIHSHGFIIEASETGIGTRARYRLTPSLKPEVEQDQVVEGGVKNFILQLLPRTTLKPQLVYLKEDEQKNVEVTMVTVPVHQVHLASNQDKEFRTVNVVQIIEDILSQDSSLRKGVVIQTDGLGWTEVTVYSLYNHPEGVVKRYSPNQGQTMETNVPNIDARKHKIETEASEVRRGDVKSAISSLLASSKDHTTPASYKQDVKGNVKLFKSCIEKGDLEYLKTFQVQEEQFPNQDDVLTGKFTDPKKDNHQQQLDDQLEQNYPDIVPVDVKKLKNMFSANQSCVQQKEMAHCGIIHSANMSPTQTGELSEIKTSQGYDILTGIESTGPVKNQSLREMLMRNAEVLRKTHDLKIASQKTPFHPEPRENKIVSQADSVEMVDEEDEISNLQAALYTLQQATMEAKALEQVALEKQKIVQHLAQRPMKNYKTKKGGA
ncbi:hypothetical protein UPYG_G00069830 [Umbra pygmaea]|uniref:Uncharacterized protein n=1 Tax=Umbra pygmaea TaxID=75934 RepID=A0ABD0XBB6_UMBPY